MFRDGTITWRTSSPNYTSTVNGQTVKGAVILPGRAPTASLIRVSPSRSTPTPVILASQDGVPGALRFSSKPTSRRGLASHGGFSATIRRSYGEDTENSFRRSWVPRPSAHGRSRPPTLVSSTTPSGRNGTPTFTLPYALPANIASPDHQFLSGHRYSLQGSIRSGMEPDPRARSRRR